MISKHYSVPKKDPLKMLIFYMDHESSLFHCGQEGEAVNMDH